MVTQLLSETLTNDATEVIKAKPNIGTVAHCETLGFYYLTCSYIVIKAERISNVSADKDYVFPDADDNLVTYTGGNAQLMVPSGLLQNISKNILLLLSYSFYCAHYMPENCKVIKCLTMSFIKIVNVEFLTY